MEMGGDCLCCFDLHFLIITLFTIVVSARILIILMSAQINAMYSSWMELFPASLSTDRPKIFYVGISSRSVPFSHYKDFLVVFSESNP